LSAPTSPPPIEIVPNGQYFSIEYCQQFNKLKWCVENGMGKEEIRIVTGMKAHLIDEYLKNMEEHNATFPP
jgi:hypothetical protein